MLLYIKREIKKSANKEKALILQRFFKTGKGEYGEGDIFLGLTVPQSRKIAHKYTSLPIADLQLLIKSKIHEERLIALMILITKYNNELMEQRRIYEFYLKNTKYINNWDLVDLSAYKIIGNYLTDKPKDILIKLANSKNIWERRISIISTFSFIKQNHFKESLKIAEILVNDREDLIQKALGWMLREIGKKDRTLEELFLNKYYKTMGRTALRYSLEKFPQTLKKKYMLGKI